MEKVFKPEYLDQFPRYFICKAYYLFRSKKEKELNELI